MPWSLFLYSQSEPSGVISRSLPKPQLTKALTIDAAKFCLALSTVGAAAAPFFSSVEAPPRRGLELASSRWAL